MRIESLRIENLRGFRDQTITLNDYTCLVGCNGAGKSTVLCALNIFFRESLHSSTDLHCLQEEDFHHRDTAKPIRITVVFTDLSEEAQENFKDYFRHGRLIVTAEANFNPEKKSAEVRQFGQRKGMAAFTRYFAADGDGKNAKELKEIYEELRAEFAELPKAGTKPLMAEALQQYEAAHPEQLELLPSSDQFYGFTKGVNRLAKYVQWVYIPAVKNAADEQLEAKNTALGQLLTRTVRSKGHFQEPLKTIRSDAQQKYAEMLRQHQNTLEALSASLKTKLQDWAHPDAGLKLEWSADPERAIRIEEPLAEIIASEGEFEGKISRFGHGLQRCYLLVLLQELAALDDAASPTLILGCEEPELHQHPPQARHLAQVFQQLSQRNSQIIVSTHSPYFVSGECFEDVRLIRREGGTRQSAVSHLTSQRVMQIIAEARGEKSRDSGGGSLAKVHQALQPSLNEMFFTRVLILVEGLEDVAYITSYLSLCDRNDDFRRLGCHIVPAEGKRRLALPITIARELGIPTFLIFDADGHLEDNGSGNRAQHAKENVSLLKLMSASSADPFPPDTLWENGLVMWHSEMGDVVRKDFDPTEYGKLAERIRVGFGQVPGLEKNTMFIASVLAEAWDLGMRSATLDKLSSAILGFAEAASASSGRDASRS